MEAIVVYALLNKKIKALISGISNIVPISGGLRFTTNLGVDIDVTLPVHTHSNLETILEKFTLNGSNELLFDGQPISGNGIMKDWTLNEHYNLHQAIVYNGSIYRAKNDIANSTTTPDIDITNFEAIGSGSVNLKDLEDVEFTMLTDGQVSVYDNVLGKWINKTLKHDDLADKNGNDDFQHITKTEKDKYDGYEVTIDDHETRISALEAGGGATGGLNIINDANLAGKTGIDYHTVTKVSYKITGLVATDVVNVFDPSKVSITGGSATLGVIGIIDNSGSKYVEIPINNLTYGVTYKISVASGLLDKNGTTLSGSAFITQFTTANAPSAPIINVDTILDSQHNLDPSTVLKVSFPVNHTGSLSLADGTKFTSIPTNIVNGSFVLNGDNLEADLHNVDEDRTYIVSVLGGIVANDTYTINSTGNSSTFSTRPSIPVVGQGNLNGNMNVDGITVHKIDFPLSTPTGLGTLVLKDGSKITVTQGSATVASSIVSGNTLSVLLNNLIDGETIKVKVDIGVIGNDDGFGNVRLQDTVVESSFTMMIHTPTITQSALNGNLDVPLTTSEITYNITSTLACTLDTSKITLTPSSIADGSAFISGNTLHIPVHNLNYDMNVTVNLEVDVIKNGGSIGNTSVINTTFQCTSSESILIDNGDLDGNGVINYTSTNQVNFNVNTTTWNTITLNNSKIVFKEDGVVKPVSSTNFNSTTHVLTIGVTLNSDKHYTLEVQSGAILNRNVSNTIGVTCSFATASTFSITNSTSNGTNIPKTSTKIVSFPYVNNEGTVSIINPTKCTGTNCTIDSVVVNGSNIDVQISAFNYSTNVAIKIDAGLAKDDTSGMTNQNSLITCNLHVIGDDVILGTSPSDTLETVPLTTTQITFPLTTVNGGSLTSTTVNSSLVTCSVSNRISSASVSGSNLVVNLMNLVNDESLTITVGTNAITNDSNNISSAKTATFKIIKQTPVIGQTTINGTRVDKTLTTIDFPISNIQGTIVTVSNILSLITSANVTISNATIVTNNTLRLTISGIDYSKVCTISLPNNIVDNGEIKNTNIVSTSFTVKGDSVVIGQSAIDSIIVSKSTTTQITFPLTTTNGGSLDSSISVNSSLITCNVGSIIASSNITGTNLIVNLNSLAFNTPYIITIGSNAITNGNTNVSNSLSTTFTTKMDVPVIGQSTVNGTKIDKSTTQLLFPITVNGSGLSLISASGITSTGGLVVGTVSVDGSNNLVVPLTGLAYSGTYSISIPANVIKNSTTNNSASITCNFTTKGEPITIGQTSINSTTTVDSTSVHTIDFPLTCASGFGTLTIDSSKITMNPSIALASSLIYNDGTNNYLRLNVNLSANNPYTIDIATGVINNNGSLSTSIIHSSFTTQALAGKTVLWREEFILPNSVFEFNTSTLTHSFTDDEFWGHDPAYNDNTIVIVWKGYKANDGNINIVHADDSSVVPRSGVDSFTNDNPDGAVSYDMSINKLFFDSGSASNKIYNIIRYTS